MIAGELRVLIVGCGAHMRTTLLPAMTQAGILPAAACDPDPARAGAVARAYGVPAFAALDDALGAVTAQAAVIAVSRSKNGELVRACVERGLPAFVEKPPAASAAEANDIAALAESRHVLVQVGFMKRHAPAYARARGIAASPTFGGARLLALEAASGPYSSLEAFLYDYCIHYLDLALHLLGPVAGVHARCPGGEKAPGPPAVQVDLAFASGAAGALTFCAGAGWHEPSERLTLYGAGARVAVENVVSCRFWRGPAPEKPAAGDDACLQWEPNFHTPQLETGSLALQGYLGEMRQFRLSLATGFPPPATLRAAARTMELVEATRDAASKKGVAPGNE